MSLPGFYKAPASKAIVHGTVLTTVAARLFFSDSVAASRALKLSLDSIASGRVDAFLVSQLSFGGMSQLAMGAMTLYSFRKFERRMGTLKFSSYVFSSMCLSVSFQLFLLAYAPSWFAPEGCLASGPHNILFPLFVHYFAFVPKIKTSPLFLGFEFSEKVFTYFVGFAIAWTSGWPGVVAAIAGFASGLLCTTNKLPFHRFQFPSAISNFAARFILPMFEVKRPTEAERAVGRRSQNRPQRAQQGQRQARPRPAAANVNVPVDETAAASLVAMGFNRAAVENALRTTGNNAEAAANLLLAAQ